MPDTMEYYEPPEDAAPPPMAAYGDEGDGDVLPSTSTPTSAEPTRYSAEDVKDWGAPEERKAYHPDDVLDWGIPTEVTSGAIGAAFRQGVQAVVPGVAGGVAGLAAAVPGAALGTVAAGPGVGSVAGGLATGIPAGMAANYGARAVQDWLLEKAGYKQGAGFFSEAQQLADVTQHPYSSFGGQLVGGAAPTFGVGAGPMVGQRVFGAGLQAGMEGAHQAYQGEGFDPAKIGMAGAAGAAFAQPRGFTQPVTSRMPGAGRSPMFPDENGNWNPLGGGPGGGGGGGGPAPGRGPRGGGGPLEGEVISPEPGALPYENTGYHARAIKNAQEQRDQHPQDSMMWKAWNDYATELQGRDENKGWVDVDASMGPRSEENPFTYRDGNAANDVTTTSSGVAHENRPVTVEGAGNPYGAPMAARIAARPNDPARNLAKDTVTPAPGVVTQPSTKISRAPISDDVAAAMAGTKPARPPAAQDAIAGRPPQAAAPAAPQVATREAAPPVPPVQMDSMASKGQLSPTRQPPAAAAAIAARAPAPTAQPAPVAPAPAAARPSGTGNFKKQLVEQAMARQRAAPVQDVGAPEEAAELGRQSTVAEMQAANARMTPEQIVEDYRAGGDGTYAQALKDIAEDARDSKDPAMQAAHAIAQSKAGAEGGPRDIGRSQPGAATQHQEQRLIDTAIAEMQAKGLDPAKLTSAPEWVNATPRERALLATKTITALRSASGTATAAGGAKDKLRMPTARAKTVTGVTPGSKALAERNDAVIAAHETAYKENAKPAGKETDQDLFRRAMRILDRATELAKGQTYKPRVKTPGMQIVAAARRFKKSPGVKGAAAFRQTEFNIYGDGKGATATATESEKPDVEAWRKRLLEREELLKTSTLSPQHKQAEREAIAGEWKAQQEATREVLSPAKYTPEEGARLEQETKRIEADIEKNRRSLPDAAAEVLLSKAREGESRGRPELRQIDNSDGGESQTYVLQHDTLVNWINGLPDDAHNLLFTLHPDLETNVATTQDPDKLRRILFNQLEATFEAVPAEDAPVVKTTSVKTAADIPKRERIVTAPATAEKLSTGTVLDRNSPEFKAIAAATLAALQAKPVVVGKEARAAADQKLAEAEQVRAEKGTFERVSDFFDEIVTDERGAVEIPEWMLNPVKTVKHTVKSFWWPGYNEPTRQYADQLGAKFVRLTNRKTEYRGKLRKNALKARDPKTKKSQLSPLEHTQLRQALELGQARALPAKLKDYYDTHIKWMEDDYAKFYDEYKAKAENYKVTGWEDLPERTSNGNGFYEFVPRIQKGSQKWDHVDEYDPYADPTKERTLDPWGGEGEASLHQFAGTAQKRGYFTLVDTVSGHRVVYIPGADSITFMRNGAPSKLKLTRDMGNFNPNQVGSTVRLKKKGKETLFQVDHSGIDEIKHAMGKDPATGEWRVEYHDNPLLTYSNALMGLQSALENLKLYDEIISSNDFQSHLKRGLSKKEVKELKYAQTNLPQFKNMWMPQRWAWVMNDFMNPSISQSWNEHDGKWAIKKLDAFSSFFTKNIVVWAPLVQAFNEADKFFIGRGAKWLSPKDTKILVKTFARAVKSVREQDDLQREIIEAGGNPMLMHTLTHGVMEQIAKASGTEVPKKLSKLDPIARVFGVSTAEAASRAYDAASAPMWWLSDILYTQRYLEEREAGLSPEKAAKSVHDFVDSYQVPPTVLGSRLAKKVLSTPFLSMFNPYHYGLLRGFATILRNLTRPDASYKERGVAAGQAAAMIALMTLVYPALSEGYASLTGNPKSKFDERGMTRIAGLVRDVAKGEKDPQSLTQIVYTPSVPTNAAWELLGNKDWRGKPIVETQNLLDPENAAKAVGQLTEYLVGQAVPPYKVASNVAMRPDADASLIAQKVIEQLIIGGINTPSPGQVRREIMRVKLQMQSERARDKRPRGLIESGVNKAIKGYEHGGLVTATATRGVIPMSER